MKTLGLILLVYFCTSLALITGTCKNTSYQHISTDQVNRSSLEPNCPSSIACTIQLLASFSQEQTDQAVYAFDNDERFNWHYVPKQRNGI